jgi:hypothetical protein
MNLELTLMELNELYYATTKLVEQNQKHLDELGKNISSINYFKTQLDRSKKLRDKIQTALHNEVKAFDDEPEYDSAGFTEDDRTPQRDYSAFEKYVDRMSKVENGTYSNLEKLGRGKSKY